MLHQALLEGRGTSLKFETEVSSSPDSFGKRLATSRAFSSGSITLTLSETRHCLGGGTFRCGSTRQKPRTAMHLLESDGEDCVVASFDRAWKPCRRKRGLRFLSKGEEHDSC